MLIFFAVSGEKRITKQTFLVLCGYLFPEKVIVLENLRKALESSSPAWLPTTRSIPVQSPTTHSIPVQSQILFEKTENRQLANMLLN